MEEGRALLTSSRVDSVGSFDYSGRTVEVGRRACTRSLFWKSSIERTLNDSSSDMNVQLSVEAECGLVQWRKISDLSTFDYKWSSIRSLLLHVGVSSLSLS